MIKIRYERDFLLFLLHLRFRRLGTVPTLLGIGRGPRYLPYLTLKLSKYLRYSTLYPKANRQIDQTILLDNLASGLWDSGPWVLAFGFLAFVPSNLKVVAVTRTVGPATNCCFS